MRKTDMKKTKTKLTLRGEQIRMLTALDGVHGGLQAHSMVTSACNTCAFSCDPVSCQPPPSGAQGASA
jgi:hypothetical protein